MYRWMRRSLLSTRGASRYSCSHLIAAAIAASTISLAVEHAMQEAGLLFGGGNAGADFGVNIDGSWVRGRDPMATLLYQQWKYLYYDPANNSLKDEARKITMADVGPEKALPHAPHLQDCPALDRLRREREALLPGGVYPGWVDLREGDVPGECPKPPWVRGSDSDNIPFLRVVQRDLWLQQHPRDCRDPRVKFAIIDWRDEFSSGLGSQLHVFASNMGRVLATGRVIVSGPWNRASHEGCEGEDHGRLECYFRGLSSQECLEVALEELERNPEMPYLKYTKQVSDLRFVRFEGYAGLSLPESLYSRWGGKEAWVNYTSTTEMGGRLWRMKEPQVYVKWWHAQTTAYMFRWPSQYLCRIVNKVRHEAYGMDVATSVASSLRERRNLDEGQVLHAEAAYDLPKVSLDSEVWLEEDPFIPRPLLSMHVRQGDKSSEMQIFQLQDVMWNAERIRLHVPDLRHVWLSTEQEVVIKQSAKYTPRWHFMYTEEHRVKEGQQIKNRDYEGELGVRAYVEWPLANLMIAADADYFVGTLGSNWNRLIDEFRKTRGRLKRGYVALNDDEW